MAVNVVKQTKLWTVIKNKLDPHDVNIIVSACSDAEDLLSRINDTFPTYTLHDGVHCKNVCDLMFELLGEQATQLTGLEAAFLVLSAFYHDIGMVYTPEEKDYLLESQDFLHFRKSHRYINDKIKANNGQVPDDIAEWFFRSIHPQRMGHVPDIIIDGIPIKRNLVALCRSHGDSVKEIISDNDLTDFHQESADLVFCAILLRLADILDFDQSRSPDVLYEYLKLKDANTPKLETSKVEFLKHKGALGFIFPKERHSGYQVRFNAQCDNIEIEHDIRSFLNVIIREFKQCVNLFSKYNTRWNNFALPASIDVRDSYGTNYQYGQYLFTVEQDKALKLFTGENLYTNKLVFVRELLQNAIDTVLHHQLYKKYNRENTDNLEVRITTWTDNENYQWIRIDDDGMGMDEEKIRKYFLKVGESFYTSAEFADEISVYKEKNIGSFTPISRFGIGVLSCFLVGDRIEVSTLSYGNKSVRLSINANKKYFTTQLEEKEHRATPMPMHPNEKLMRYRNKCGTSIAVRIAPYQYFENLDFKEIVNKYILYPPVPVYLNGERFITENEFLDTVDNVNVFELPIPNDVIEYIKQEYRVTIHSGASVKVGFLNLNKYISEQNRSLLKGALFLTMGHNLTYTDDFCGKNNIKDKRAHAQLEVGVANHCVQIILRREPYFEGLSDLPKNERKWFSALYEGREYHNIRIDMNAERYPTRSRTDIGIDFRTYDWYNKHLASLVDKDAYFQLMPKFAHNGISYLYNIHRRYIYDYYDYGYNKSLFSVFGCLPILLCHDSYRPELSVSREEIRSLPLEMESEVNLAIRKAINDFNPQAQKIIDINLINFISLRDDDFSPSLITAERISSLSNFDVSDGWYDYYSLSYPGRTYEEKVIMNPKTLSGAIYGTLIQKYKQCRLVKTKKDDEYVLQIHPITEETNNIVYNYYPPLFFMPVDNEDLLFVKYSYNRGCINLHHSNARKIIAITETLCCKYPALFNKFVNAVYDGDNDVNDLFNKIKGLPLWKNS